MLKAFETITAAEAAADTSWYGRYMLRVAGKLSFYTRAVLGDRQGRVKLMRADRVMPTEKYPFSVRVVIRYVDPDTEVEVFPFNRGGRHYESE